MPRPPVYGDAEERKGRSAERGGGDVLNTSYGTDLQVKRAVPGAFCLPNQRGGSKNRETMSAGTAILKKPQSRMLARRRSREANVRLSDDDELSLVRSMPRDSDLKVARSSQISTQVSNL